MPKINEPKLSYLKDAPNQQIAYTIAILNNSICALVDVLKENAKLAMESAEKDRKVANKANTFHLKNLV